MCLKQSINDNKWHYVLMSDADSGSVNGWNLYVDGVNVKQLNGTATISNSNPLYIGMRLGTSLPFSGSIDDVRIFGSAIPASKIREQYFLGLNRLLKNSAITLEEYRNRLAQSDEGYAGIQ